MLMKYLNKTKFIKYIKTKNKSSMSLKLCEKNFFKYFRFICITSTFKQFTKYVYYISIFYAYKKCKPNK